MSAGKTKRIDLIFLVIAGAILLQALLPVPVFVRAAGKKPDAVVSWSLPDGGQGKTLFVSEKNRGEQITLVTREKDCRVRIYAGLFKAAELSRNPQDGEYYSRIILDSFLEEETVSHPLNDYFRDMTIAQLFQTYQDDYMILFAVSGDSSEGWDADSEEAFLKRGFTETPGQAGKVSAGWYYKGKAFIRSEADSIKMDAFAGDRLIHLESADEYHGDTAVIAAGDHEDMCAGRNGLNIAVYDPVNDVLIDSVSYNTNTSDPVMNRADELFYSEYVSVFREGLSEYILEAAGICRNFVRAGSLFLLIVLSAVYADIKRNDRAKRAGIPLLAAMIMFTAVRRSYLYLASSFKGISFEQLVFHLNTDLNGLNWNGFGRFFFILAMECLAAVLLYALITFLLGAAGKILSRNGREGSAGRIVFLIRTFLLVLAVSLILSQTGVFLRQYRVTDYLISRGFETDLYDSDYVPADETEIIFPEKKMNLIYIFLESMEISLADEENGGGKGFNAIPELTDLAMRYDCFRGEEEQLNGALPLYNSTWTIAGMAAQSSGLPLGINHYYTNTAGSIRQFMPGALTLGDILEEQGYRNVMMMGSDARFGNRDVYYREHGSYEILDYVLAKKTGVIPAGYKVFWGMEDSRLFDWAKQTAGELADSGDPFNLQFLTVDTHFPNGWKCGECPDLFPDQYSNAFACASRQVSDFVDWVYEQPWGEDTVVVICGDHLCMGTAYFDDMPGEYERKTYTVLINSRKEENGRFRYYSTMDLFPTTLSAMGCTIKGDRLAFGTDLYSNTPTLLERRDKNELNYQLSLHSDYYQNVILYGREESD